MFEDLCRQTPVCDDPEAHAELEKALFRLQETIREVNKAKDDPKTRRLIEISWQLQDRLAFQEQVCSSMTLIAYLIDEGPFSSTGLQTFGSRPRLWRASRGLSNT